MNVFTAFNDAYVFPAKVMLKSLIENNPEPLIIYILYSSLQQKSIDSIMELEDGERVSVRFLQVEDSFLDGVAIPDCFSRETYYRLFAHRYIPEEVDRILWLDGDLIINGSLAGLYHHDFQGKRYIAVEDAGFEITETKKPILQMPPDSKYINSGVLLFNLKELRRTSNDEAIVQYLVENQDILDFADQDVFNGLLHDYFLPLDISSLYNFFAWDITRKNEKYIYQNAKVIHFCAVSKPWKKNCRVRGFDLWWSYALQLGPEYEQVRKGLIVNHAISLAIEDTKHWAKRCFPKPYGEIKAIYHRIIDK